MRGSADMAGMPDVRSRRAFFGREIVCQDQPLEMKLEFTPNFSHSEMRAVRGPFFGMSVRAHFFSAVSQLFFCGRVSWPQFRQQKWSVFCDLAAGKRNHRARSTPFSCSFSKHPPADNALFSEGERCMKDTDHPIRHPSRHPRIFGRVRSRRSCACHDDQFGRGQNTGLGWSDPTFVHVSVPKVIRGVAPAQLRGDRAECFVRVQMGAVKTLNLEFEIDRSERGPQ